MKFQVHDRTERERERGTVRVRDLERERERVGILGQTTIHNKKDGSLYRV